MVVILFSISASLFTASSQTSPTKGQSGGQQLGPPGTIRVRVGLVPVDVIVTDDHDRPVTDLRQEDFQVFENGRPQDIRHFSVQAFTPAAKEVTAPSTLRLVPTLELAPQEGRTFLILLGRWPDLAQGGAHQTVTAVDALIQFVRSDLLPQDQVAVYAYNRATDFTTDHEQVVRVLEQYKKVADKVELWLQSHLRGFAAYYGAKQIPQSLQPNIDAIFSEVPELASRQVPQGRITAEGKIVGQWDKATGLILGDAAEGVSGFDQTEADAITLGLPFDEFIPRAADAIQDAQNIYTCIEYLRYMEGEKHLLFFTGNGMLFPEGDADIDKGIAGVANDARVAIDTFQTGGLAPTIMPTTGGVQRSAGKGATTPAPAPAPMGSVFSSAGTFMIQSLKNISALTGGHTAVYQDLGKALATVNEATRAEYLLGYYPKDENWNGKYRQINVKVDRPGLKLFFRRGYFARDKLQPYDRAEFLAFSRISAAGGWAEDIDDISFKLSTSRATDERSQPQLKVDLKIAAAKLAFKNSDNLHVGKLRIALFYADSAKRPLGNIWKTLDLKLPDANYQEYMKSGIPCSILIPTNSKDLFLKAVVYDMQGDRVGSRQARVEKLWAP